MVVAEFKGNETTKYVGDVYQYDLGQVLCIKGLNLPKFVEIDFALQETGSTTESEIGITRNGVTEVEIPNHMLINNDIDMNYMIYAFVYLTDKTSGETIRKIRISVKARSKPENFTAPEDTKLFQEAIKAVNESAERAETAEQQAAEHAEQTKLDAIKTSEDRTAIAELVESVSGIEQQVETVKEYKEQAQTAATNALLSEQKSEQAKEFAIAAQANAETAEGKAEQHALEVAGDKSEVERLATQVRRDKSSVEQTVQGFGNTAQQAIQSVNTAKTQAVNAINTAEAEAIKAVEDKGAEQTGNVTAEGENQVQAVQAKGQEVINSIPSDYTTQMATKLDKQQGTENAGKALVIGEDGNVVPGEVESSGTQTLKLLSTIDITQQVNKVQCDFPGEYDVYYVFGNCFIPEESSGTIVLYQNIKTTEGVGYIKFYDTYGNKGKTLNVSLEFKRKKKEDGSCIIKMSGMYTISTYVTGQVVNVIDTGWINKDNGGKKILKYTGISLSALIKSGHLEIYGGV